MVSKEHFSETPLGSFASTLLPSLTCPVLRSRRWWITSWQPNLRPVKLVSGRLGPTNWGITRVTFHDVLTPAPSGTLRKMLKSFDVPFRSISYFFSYSNVVESDSEQARCVGFWSFCICWFKNMQPETKCYQHPEDPDAHMLRFLLSTCSPDLTEFEQWDSEMLQWSDHFADVFGNWESWFDASMLEPVESVCGNGALVNAYSSHMLRSRTVEGCAGEDHQGPAAPRHRLRGGCSSNPQTGTLVNRWSLILSRSQSLLAFDLSSSWADQLHSHHVRKVSTRFLGFSLLLQELDPPKYVTRPEDRTCLSLIMVSQEMDHGSMTCTMVSRVHLWDMYWYPGLRTCWLGRNAFPRSGSRSIFTQYQYPLLGEWWRYIHIHVAYAWPLPHVTSERNWHSTPGQMVFVASPSLSISNEVGNGHTANDAYLLVWSYGVGWNWMHGSIHRNP